MTDTPDPVRQPAPQMIDPNTGSVSPLPPQPEPPPTSIMSQYREGHPELSDTSDYVVARGLYEHGVARPKESFPEFATRIGITQGPTETALNTGLSSAAFHVNEPLESAMSGLAALLHGGQFGEGYRTKHQELSDQHDVGAYQNPASNIAGNVVGNVADYVRFGPLIRQLADAVPGLAYLARTGPVGDAATKMAGLAEGQQIPQTIENQVMRQDNPSLGQRVSDVGADIGKAGLEGAASGVLGAGLGKAITGAGNLASSIGKGFQSADEIARGIPRSAYTSGAAKVSSNFTGAAPSPARAGLEMDTDYYTKLLDRGSLSVPKATAQLTTLMDQPGMALPIITAAAKAAPGGTLDTLLDGLHEGNSGSITDATEALKNMIAQKQALDPTGQDVRTFLANIYKEIIPMRLQGPVDPAAGFDRNAVSGRLSDRGKLIQPPVTGVDRLAQQIYEGLGGGPGRVMFPLLTQAPRTAAGGGAAVLGQGVTVPLALGGRALNYAGKAVSEMGEPGTAAANMVPDMFGGQAIRDTVRQGIPQVGIDAIQSAAESAGRPDAAGFANSFKSPPPNLYQSGLLPAMTGQNNGAGSLPEITVTAPHPGGAAFPDVHQPDRHSEIEPHDANWLGQADRPTALAYIGSRLGPQAAQQLQATDDVGYKAGLLQLMFNPDSRKALYG